MTPSERLELHATLQQQAFASMRSNSAAMEAFIRRNHQQRRISSVRRLEAEMRKNVERFAQIRQPQVASANERSCGETARFD